MFNPAVLTDHNHSVELCGVSICRERQPDNSDPLLAEELL